MKYELMQRQAKTSASKLATAEAAAAVAAAAAAPPPPGMDPAPPEPPTQGCEMTRLGLESGFLLSLHILATACYGMCPASQ